MTKIHDSGYKKLFSNKTIFRQLLQTFVKEPWVDELDFDSCETIDKSFISEHYKTTESDLIYKIRLNDQDLYIFILIEFQSTVDRFMAVRIPNYITNFYMDYLETHKNVDKLPPIFPILLYNGDKRWTAPQNIADLIDNNTLLGEYGLNFTYFKIAENEYDLETLQAIRNIVSTLFLAESHYDIELLKREFLAIFKTENDKQAVSLFLNWFKQLSQHQRIEPEDYTQLEQVYRNAEEVHAMLITALNQERMELLSMGREEGLQEGLQEGIQKGIQRGIQKGIQKGKLEIATVMLHNGFSVEAIAKLTNLQIELIQELADGEIEEG